MLEKLYELKKRITFKKQIVPKKQTLLKKRFLSKNSLLLIPVLLSFFFYSVVSAKTIVVFIHGTVLPGLSLLDMSGAHSDKLDESSRYVQAAQRVREDTRFWEDQAVLGEGLWPIMTIANQEGITQESVNRENTNRDILAQKSLKKENSYQTQSVTCQRDERFAVYPLTRTFDAMAHWSGYLEGDVSYYAFGHLGLLSQTYRKEQGCKLYKELMCLVHQTHEPTRIIICAHSHGGNIALYLAEAEEQFRQGLFVDDLLLFGTPVQLETACCAFKKPFKRVVSFFSSSDSIQLSDWLSTKSAASFRTFTVPHKQGKCRYMPPAKSYGQVIDMRCQVNGDTRCLTHQNFWYLGRSRRLCPMMDMLPLMVLAPVYVTLLRNHATSYKMLVDAQLNQKNCSPRTLPTTTSQISMAPASATSSNASCVSACPSLSCTLVFPGKITQGLTASEAQQFGKLVQFYDRDAKLSWQPIYKHRILLLYREDFMREMLGLFSWIDFKVRLWGYKTLKSVRKWFGGEQHC
jgi:hypothetical protein